MAVEAAIKYNTGDFTLDIDIRSNAKRIGILGTSGAGKSMTLKMIAGILRPDQGKIAAGDHVLFDSEKRIDVKTQKRKVGYLFQNYALFPSMTAAQNIAAGIPRK